MMRLNVLQRLLLIVSVFCSALLTSHVQAKAADFVYPGEELVYRVSYLNITLGTIRAITEPYTTIDGKKAAHVKVYLSSHPNIPFLSLHSTYESWMDTSMTYSHKFNANTMIDDNKWEFDQYLFDYTAKTLIMEKYRDKQKVQAETLSIKKKYNDGCSLLYAARALLLSRKSFRLPTVIMDDTVNTVINFQATKGEVEIDASSYPVKSVYFNGDANWTGVYGLTGRFEGWFSDDEARIPLKAKMSLYVGAATIELQSWKRGTWQPPK